MIDFDQILYADRWTLKDRKQLGRKWNLLSVLNDLFFTRIKLPPRRAANFVFFRCLIRNDYKLLMHDIASVIEEDNKIFFEDYLQKTTKAALSALIPLFKLLPNFFAYQADNFYERLYLYLRLCFYYRHLGAVSKYNFETIVFFADMQPVENLLAQHFRLAGKNTVTLQHGLYVNYGTYPTVNVINYLHQPSEYFLAWGNNTAALINESGKDRNVLICGKPVVALNSFTKVNTSASLKDSIKYFTVILDQNIFEPQNIVMLRLLADYAEKASLKMNVRYHPYNKVKVYQDLDLIFRDDLDLESSKFVVGHTSSLMYEIMLLGIPVFKFASDIPCVAMPDELIFDSLSRLHEVVSSADKIDFEKLSTEYIAFFGDESLKKYGDFFDALKNNRTVELESENE